MKDVCEMEIDFLHQTGHWILFLLKGGYIAIRQWDE
ncbi:hypothetical protein EVA_21031 [gut metagenome]|uniref:Uncharacterized protein n=1 Tax=gut metagenome TaxID=749906 RepID=J9F7J5_9ZZZZ